MKKSLLFLLTFFVTFLSFSQFSLTINGGEAVDGDIFTFNTTGAEADMLFVLTNTNATEDINVKVTVTDMVNATGNADHVQFCWGVCATTISIGTNLPPVPETLAPGESTHPSLNHFENFYTGDDANVPVSYTFKFYEVDGSGNEIGTPIAVTYIYDADWIAIENFTQVPYKLYPSVTTDSFTLEVQEKITATVLNTNGQIVQEFTVDTGTHTVDVSTLTSQLYYVVLANAQGQKSLTKIIIK